MCSLFKMEERQWLPPTPTGAFVQAELCCHDLGALTALCWMLPAAPQSCFLEILAFPRGLLTNLFLENTGKRWRSGTKAILKFLGNALTACPLQHQPLLTATSREALGCSCGITSGGKVHRDCQSPWQHLSHRDGTEDDTVTVLLCLGADQHLHRGPEPAQGTGADLSPACVQGEQTTETVEQPGKTAEMQGAQKLQAFPLKEDKILQQLLLLFMHSFEQNHMQVTSGLWLADTALHVLQKSQESSRDSNKRASKASLQNTHFMCAAARIGISPSPRLQGTAFSLKSADHTNSE